MKHSMGYYNRVSSLKLRKNRGPGYGLQDLQKKQDIYTVLYSNNQVLFRPKLTGIVRIS
jgi:hypothetical protein